MTPQVQVGTCTVVVVDVVMLSVCESRRHGCGTLCESILTVGAVGSNHASSSRCEMSRVNGD